MQHRLTKGSRPKGQPAVQWALAALLCLQVLATWSADDPPASQPVVPTRAFATNRVVHVDPKDLALWEKIYGHETRAQYLHRWETSHDPLFVFRHPVNFWGWVEDQYGNPIQGANVEFYPPGETVKRRSGADGGFKLLGYRGDNLGVHLVKEGYYSDQRSWGYTYNYGLPSPDRFIPDPRTPVRHVLYKPRPGAEVTPSSMWLRVPPDGTRVGFDPVANRYTTNGPLFFRCWMAPTSDPSVTNMEFEVSGQGCGVLRTLEELPWDAPAGGYQPSAVKIYTRETRSVLEESLFKVYFHVGSLPAWGVIEMETIWMVRRDGSPMVIPTTLTVTTNSTRRLDHPPRDAGTFHPLPDAVVGPFQNGIIRTNR